VRHPSGRPAGHQLCAVPAGSPAWRLPVLIVSWKRLERAVAALRRFREAGLPLALITNTIACTRAWIAAALSGAGFAVTVADVLPEAVSGEMLDLGGELAARVSGVDDAARLEEEQRGRSLRRGDRAGRISV